MKIFKHSIFAAALLALSALSCDKVESPVSEPEEITVSYSVTLDEQTKAVGEGESANYIWYAIYKVIESNGTATYTLATQPALVQINSGSAECPVTMVRDQSYKVVFVAQHYTQEQQSKTPAYQIHSDNATLWMPQTAVANSDNYDVFAYVDTIEKYVGLTNKSVELSRLTAQINFYADPDDLKAATAAGKTPEQSSVTLAGVPEYISLLDGTVSANTITVEYNKADSQNDLATVFCLSRPEGNDVNASLYIYNGTDTLLKEYAPITRIPCRANYRTNVKISYKF